MPVMTYIGVVFSFMGSLSLDCYHFYLLMILKETLTFLSLSNPVLQYVRKEEKPDTYLQSGSSIDANLRE